MAYAAHDVEKNLPVHQEVTCIGIDGKVDLFGPHQFLFIVARNDDDAVYLPFEKEFFRFVEAGRFVNDVDVGCGVERTDQLAARRRAAVIDYRDGHVAQHFVFIGERIGRRVDENGAHGNQQYTCIAEDVAVFVAQHRGEFAEFLLKTGRYHFTVSPSIFLRCIFSSFAAA